jgi:3-oxoacyl-[acyl-carrier-protein] synthase-1
MSAPRLAILGTGLVTSVGFNAAACGCAFRAKLSNPSETTSMDANGAWIMGHQVGLEPPRSGLAKLASMAASAIEEALRGLKKDQWHRLPMLLCVAEASRPARMAGLDGVLMVEIQRLLGAGFSPESAVVPHGRVGVAVAIDKARALLASQALPGVLIVGADSLLSSAALSHYERADRLLTEANANGFMPGEGAGALWVSGAQGHARQLVCTGTGFGMEAAHIDSEEPQRADGLCQAIKACMDEAGRALHDMDFRITDIAGEHYYFKEAALALTRLLRQGKDSFDIWHPAECTGEIGAASGVAMIAAAREACLKGYAPGRHILVHWANDAGQRAAITLEFQGTT